MRALIVLVAACGAAPASPGTPPSEAPWPVPDGWRSEVIPFPLDFAPSLAHRGVEDLRFPPGMFDPSSPEYWSYAFTWHTDDAAEVDADALGRELTVYFAGLIAAVDDKKQRIAPADRQQIAAHATAAGPGRFALTAHVYDAFKTAAAVELAGTAVRRACGTGALWTFVLAPPASPLRARLDELASKSSCLRPTKP